MADSAEHSLTKGGRMKRPCITNMMQIGSQGLGRNKLKHCSQNIQKVLHFKCFGLVRKWYFVWGWERVWKWRL